VYHRVRNKIYQILRGEFDGVGAGEPGQRAQDMLKIDRPTIDSSRSPRAWASRPRVTTADDFNKALRKPLPPGPRLIEVQFDRMQFPAPCASRRCILRSLSIKLGAVEGACRPSSTN